MFGLDVDTLRDIREIFAKHPRIEKVLLYGSRAMGNYKNGSDIDITLIGENLTYKNTLNPLTNELDEHNIPYGFDVSIFEHLDSQDIVSHILRVGKTFYARDNEDREGWDTTTLGELCEFRRGLTYKKGDEVPHSKNAVLRANNITVETGKINLDEIRFIRDEFDIPDSKKLQAGCLLVCTASGSKKHLGKIGLVEEDSNYAFGGFMGLLIPTDRVLPKYLFWLTRSYPYREFINALSDGINIHNLKWDQLSQFPIPLPPLPEQKQIVAILDQVFAAIDTVTANTQKNLTNARELLASELNSVFQNLNIIEDRGDEREEWDPVTLGAVCEVIAGQSPKGSSYNDAGDGLPFYQGKKEFRDKHIDSPVKWTTQVTREAVAGDILMSVRAPVGPINFATERICIGRGLASIRAGKHIHREFLFYLLLSMQDQIKGSEGAVFASINKKQIEDIRFSKPLLSKQKQIASRLDEFSTQTQSLISHHQTKLAVLTALKQSLLQKAFAGALTTDHVPLPETRPPP